MSIASKLTIVREAQKAIRSAILGKGVSITGDFTTYADAISLLKNPQGSVNITSNGTYPVADKAEAIVNVPSSGIIPVGTLDITANGNYDVTEKESVNVNVPVGVFPSGTLNINDNGDYDVTTKAAVSVNVPKGASPVYGQISGSGAKTLQIPDAVGKDNISIFLTSTSSSNVSISTFIGAGCIDGSMHMIYKSSSNISRQSNSASWNKSTGTFAYTGSSSYNFTNNIYVKYVYVAW